LDDRKLARELGQPSAAIRAAELLGKQLGMFIDKKEVKVGQLDDLSPEILDAIVEQSLSETTRRLTEGGGDSQEPAEDTDILPRSRSA